MLKERLTDARWTIWLYDPALPRAVASSAITPDQLHKFAASRDIADLGGLESVLAWADPPTAFKLRPMGTQHQVIEDRPEMLFALCLDDIKNCPASWLQWEKGTDGSRHITDEALSKMPRDCVVELGELVREMATRDGDDLPFTRPATWPQHLSQSIARAVLSARIAPVPMGEVSAS